MRKLAITLAIIWTADVQAAVIGSLISNHNYDVYRDGTFIETSASTNDAVTVEFPAGKHTIQLYDMGPVPTQTPSPTPPVVSDDPTPTPTPSIEPTHKGKGRKVFVAGFDKEKKKNRFEVLDTSGKSFNLYNEVLSGVSTEGQMEIADLNGDGTNEIIAFGASTTGIKLEYWTGQGQLLQTRNTLSSWHHFDIRFFTCDFDGNDGEEVLVMGRNQSGIYRFEAYDSEGNSVVTYPSIVLGYHTIEKVALDDVDGDGAKEVVVFGRTQNERTEATVIGMEGVESPITLFGIGYSPISSGFTLDLDGDGVYEIASLARSGMSSFRLIVTDVFGQIRLKKNVLSSKFGDEVQACAADVDGDGCQEIVVSGRLTDTGQNIVQVFDHDGFQVVAHTYLDSGFNGQTTNLFTDIDNDQSLEFIVAGRDSMTGSAAYQVFQGGQTEMLYGGFLLENGIEGDPDVMTNDLDLDGNEELIVTGKLASGDYAVEMRDLRDGTLTFQTTFSTKIIKVSAGLLD